MARRGHFCHVFLVNTAAHCPQRRHGDEIQTHVCNRAILQKLSGQQKRPFENVKRMNLMQVFTSVSASSLVVPTEVDVCGHSVFAKEVKVCKMNNIANCTFWI